MISPMAFFAVFSIIVFLAGCALGALVIFVVSIHRTRRASLFETRNRRCGAVSRSVLITTRTGRKENGE